MSPFGPLSTAFHDAAQVPASDAEVAWYASRLPANRSLVLEGMCGYGRTLVPSLKRGFNVHGVDSSSAMIAACQSHLAASGIDTTLFRQDLSELNLPFRYTACYVSGGSFQLLTAPRAASTALARIKAHLVPPGILLLDLIVPDAGLHPPGAPIVEVRMVRLADGARITLRDETVVHADARRLDVTSRFERRDPDGNILREDARHARTWYEEADIIGLLEAAGFTDIAIEPTPRPDDAERRFAVSARAAN